MRAERSRLLMHTRSRAPELPISKLRIPPDLGVGGGRLGGDEDDSISETAAKKIRSLMAKQGITAMAGSVGPARKSPPAEGFDDDPKTSNKPRLEAIQMTRCEEWRETQG